MITGECGAGWSTVSGARLNSDRIPDFDSLWDYSDPAGSESRFLALLPLFASWTDSGPLVELLSQIARAQGFQRQFEDADATLRRARSLLNTASRRAAIRVLLETGRVEHSSERPGCGEASFRAALAAAESAGEEVLAVDAAHMLGIVTRPDEDIAWNLRAIEMASRSRDPKARCWLGTLYANLASTHQDAGRLDDALELFLAAEAWARDHGRMGQLRKAKWRVARCRRLRGQVNEAFAIQLALAREDEAAGRADGYVFKELGHLLLAQGAWVAAATMFRKARETLAQDPWRLSEAEATELSRLEWAAVQTHKEVYP